jgi:hypothetical protein
VKSLKKTNKIHILYLFLFSIGTVAFFFPAAYQKYVTPEPIIKANTNIKPLGIIVAHFLSKK